MSVWARIKVAAGLWLVLALVAGFSDIFIRSKALEDLFFASAIFHVVMAGVFLIIAPYFAKLLRITVDNKLFGSDSLNPNGYWDKLSFALIGLLVALLVAAWSFGIPAGPAPRGLGPIFMGLFFVALGFMFLASYFYYEKYFLLHWLLRFS